MYFRRLVCILPVLLLASTSFAVTTPKPAPKPSSDTIRAKRIELTDDQGNVRVSIGLTSDGAAIIKMLDKNGNPTLALRSDQGLGFLTPEGKRQVVVGSSGAGYGIGVYDSKGNPRAELTMVNDEPYMAMSDADHKFRMSMFLLQDQPFISMTDGKDEGASILMKVKGSAPQIVLSDSIGKARSEYSLVEDGNPRLLMAASEGPSCVNLSVSNGRPNLIVSDPKTNVAGNFGFTTAGDLGLMLLNSDQKLRAAMVLKAEDDPLVYVIHPSGNPAAEMGIYNEKGYFSTQKPDGGLDWQNP